MTGPSPNPVRSVKRRRNSNSLMPWALISVLFALYVVIGLVLSVPAPPYWVWGPAILGTLLLVFGLNRPAQEVGRRKIDPIGLLTYLGGLLLAIALAVGTNYIGGESLDGMSFLVALFGLAGFTLLAVVLTAAAGILSAQTGARLSALMAHSRSLGIVMSICIFGIALGGLLGFSVLIVSR